MISKRFSRIAIIAVFIATGQAYGQNTPEPKPNAELNRKAQALLSDTVTLARQLKNKENQVRARMALAELQWNDQEKSARLLYQEAFEVVRHAWSNVDPDDDEAPYSESSVIQLRDRLIQSVAQHDPALARQLFEQMRVARQIDLTNADANTAQSERADDDKALEAMIAMAAAESNSDEKLRLIREQLAAGSLDQAVTLLEKLAEKDPEKAGTVIGDVVEKFRKSDFQSESETVNLAAFLLSQALATLPKYKKERESLGRKDVIPVPPEVSRQIAEAVTDAALNAKEGRARTVLLQFLYPAIEDIAEIAPAQAERLKKKFAEANKPVDPYSQFQELATKKEIDPMLQAARNAPLELRDGFYSQAADVAWEQGDRAKAKEIVEKNIRSSFERNRLLRHFREIAIADSIKKGDLMEARHLIQQTRSTESRVNQLIDLAAAYVLKKDNKTAVEVLTEAQNLIPAKAANQTQLDLEIKLAKAFAGVDLDRSFILMGAAIEQINELGNAAARVSSFMGVMATLKDNEFELDSWGMPGLGTGLPSDLRQLAESDFEKTRKMLDKFERPEFRVSAYLGLARMILNPETACSCSCPASTPKN